VNAGLAVNQEEVLPVVQVAGTENPDPWEFQVLEVVSAG